MYEVVEGYFDGGCGPKNPGGHGTYGIVIRTVGGKTLLEESGYLGQGCEMSNNVAEYAGIIAIFRFLLKNKITQGVIYGDSKLVVMQLNGKWRIRSGLYYKWAKEAIVLRRELPQLKIQWIPRERNREADYLARQALPSARRIKRNTALTRLIKEQRADQRETARRMMNKLFL